MPHPPPVPPACSGGGILAATDPLLRPISGAGTLRGLSDPTAAQSPSAASRPPTTPAAPLDAVAPVEVGVGPHPLPWPDDARLDPALLAEGDRRNVADQYRYWSNAAIVADLDARRHPFHVAIENWQHDFNIGAVVRN